VCRLQAVPFIKRSSLIPNIQEAACFTRSVTANGTFLRVLLETIIPKQASMDGFEVAHDFPDLGRRIMLLNARQVTYGSRSTILPSIH
jgi:hypothetical protein